MIACERAEYDRLHVSKSFAYPHSHAISQALVYA